MKQTKELRLSKKIMCATALLLAVSIFVMSRGNVTQAATSSKKVVKNGLVYILMSEAEFKESYKMAEDDESSYDQYLEQEKYNLILTKIRENGGIYVVTDEYMGNSSSISIENTIDGKPVMIENIDSDTTENIKSVTIPANVVEFNLMCEEINMDPNNQWIRLITNILW